MVIRLFLLVLFALSLSACLKSRAQLYGDADESRSGNELVSSQPQPVSSNSYAVEEMKAEIMRLTGKIEDLERNSRSAEELQAAQEKIQKLENRIAELENAQLALIESLQKKEAEATKRNPSDIFLSAREAYRAGQLDQAISFFKEYLKSDDKTHAEEARFLLGEALFSKKEFKEAIVYFSELNEKHPNSRRVPAALQKIAQSFERLGFKEEARGFYQELVEKHPKSPEARASKSKIK